MKTKLLKTMLMALIMMGTANVFAQTTYLDMATDGFNPANGWTESTAKTSTIVSNSITCADAVVRTFKYAMCFVNKSSGGTVTGDLYIGKSSAGYLEFPEFPTIGAVTIYASSTGTKDYTLQRWTGSAWTDAATFTVATAGATTFNYTSGVPVTLRIISKNGSGDVQVRSLKIVGVAGDPVPPTMLSSVPANSATGISPTITSVTATFDKNIKAGTGNITVTDGTTPQTIAVSGCTFNNATITIPVSGLTIANTYTVTIPVGAIQNLSSAATTSASTFSFQTKTTLSSAADITSINFGARQIGTSVINTNTINVTLMPATSLTIAGTPSVAQISTPVIAVSPFATATTVPTDFSLSKDIIVTAEDGSTKKWTVNFTEAPVTAATLPVAMLGVSSPDTWLNGVQTGYVSNILNASSSTSISATNWYSAQLSKQNQFIMIKYTGTANTLTFRARYGNNTSGYQLDVQESSDGNTWSNIVSYTPSNIIWTSTSSTSATASQPSSTTVDPTPPVPTGTTSFGVLSYPVLSASQYIRWYYTYRTATTFYLDDVNILFNIGTSVNSLDDSKFVVSQKENTLTLSENIIGADLYNVLGAKVQSFKNSMLNICNLPKGVYVVNYTTNKMTQGNSKVIIK
jgi:hypothetical protein